MNLKKIEKITPILLLILAVLIRYGVPILLSKPFFIGADTLNYTTSINFGHFLTTSITQSLPPVSYPLFFGSFLLVSLCFFLKDDIDLKIACFLFPFATLVHWQLLGMAIYAQLFSLSLFLIGSRLFLDGRTKLSVIVFPFSVLAHFWTGGIMLLIFILYLSSRSDLSKTLKISLPALAVLGLITVAFPNLVPVNIHSGDLSYFFTRVIRMNFGLVFFSVFGIYHFSEIWTAGKEKLIRWWVVVPLILFVVLFCFLKRFWSLVPLFIIAVGGANFLKENRADLFYSGLALMLWSGFIFV